MKSYLNGLTCAAVLLAAGFTNAQAAPLVGNGVWHGFDVSDALSVSGGTEWIDIAGGTPLDFTFIIGAGKTGLLTVVDTGYAGDTYSIYDGAALRGTTSPVGIGLYTGDPGVATPRKALFDPSFSRASFILGPGSYSITGILEQSVLDVTGAPLNSTAGAIRLTTTRIPEPATCALLLAGLGLVGVRARRRT